jgi:hypothetical protein
MKTPEGKKQDLELMKKALKKFEEEGQEKFLKGIEEHNSDGSRGMNKMSKLQKVKAIKEEIIDLWFYISGLEEDIDE